MRKNRMNPLILWMLKKYCDEHDELDYQEIDETLTYSENIQHLKSLLPYMDPASNDWNDVELWRAEEETASYRAEEARYMAEHRLHDYIMAKLAGETVTIKQGRSIKPIAFSITDYIQRTKT